MKDMHIKITFTEPLLGTASADPSIHETFIASKAPDALSREEEVAVYGVEEVNERATTIFPRLDDGSPFLWDYQVKGYLKDACSMLRRVPGTKSNKLAAHKKVIDGLIFPEPRKIKLVLPDGYGNELETCERPLRASTAQGDRVALACSEMCPAGTTIEFRVKLFKDSLAPTVKEWFDYGAFRGIGQWRNSGMGRFEVEYLD